MGPRLDIANNFAERVAEPHRPEVLIETVLGPIARPKREQAVARAESRQQALALAVHVARIPAEVIMAARIHLPSRREMLIGSGSLFAWAHMPKLARAEGRDPRMLVIVLRARSTGLAAVAPVGDPDWISLRGDRALVLDGKTPALPLDSFFALNPAMPNLHRLYKAQQATIVHATATPYRERSHFDGQDVLESGLAKPGATDTRLAQPRALVARGRMDASIHKAAAPSRVGPVTPLVVRGTGAGHVVGAAAAAAGERRHQMRLLDLYRHTDAEAGARVRRPLAISPPWRVPAESTAMPQRGGRRRQALRAFGTTSETLRARPRVPRTARRPARRRARASWAGIRTSTKAPPAGNSPRCSVRSMRPLPRSRQTMGDAWRETVVAVVTEFGRTARINGTDGTDHGTGTVALLAGGAFKGGRVIADWPGLKPADLHEGRDLKPTIDLRAVLKGLLRDHLRVDDVALATSIFPGSDEAEPMAGLLA